MDFASAMLEKAIVGQDRDEAAELRMENIAIAKALGHFEMLGMAGGLLRVGGRIVAMTIGEPLNRRVFVTHFEKADTDYDGAYTMINHFDFNNEHNCKLAWKIDWPMRWMFEGVDFEPGGKDHATVNGSYDTSKEISKAIFNYEPPIFQGYEFIGIKGTTGKMSGSSGLNHYIAVGSNNTVVTLNGNADFDFQTGKRNAKAGDGK